MIHFLIAGMFAASLVAPRQAEKPAWPSYIVPMIGQSLTQGAAPSLTTSQTYGNTMAIGAGTTTPASTAIDFSQTGLRETADETIFSAFANTVSNLARLDGRD